MLASEIVFQVFADYLEKDTALEIPQSRHGYAVLLWDATSQGWSDVVCCSTPEALFEKLLESATCYYEYKYPRTHQQETLDAEDEKQIAHIRQYYLNRKETMK